MRASTLFALTVAVLLGLAVAVSLKVSGYFDKPAAAKKPDVSVLVASRNLFAGDVIDSSWVSVRPLKPEEQQHYDEHKDKYLPAVTNAVYLRVAAKNVEADKPILKEHLQDMAKPESVSQRLLPNMRAVNVAVAKDESAGGLIQVGEWVDVLLTSDVEAGDSAKLGSRTAAIAHKLRVITKRNGLWPVFAPLPDGPVHFALEANPYRSALIEFAKTRGTLTLAPVSASEQRLLEEKRNQLLQGSHALRPVSFVKPEESVEYRDEEARVDAVGKGELAINNLDLVRLFGLKTPEPPTLPISIQQFAGATRYRPAVFNQDGSFVDPSPRGGEARAGRNNGFTAYDFRFTAPDCPTCKDKAAARRPAGR
jgi:Flp pilus assembly protein CpaB